MFQRLQAWTQWLWKTWHPAAPPQMARPHWPQQLQYSRLHPALLLHAAYQQPLTLLLHLLLFAQGGTVVAAPVAKVLLQCLPPLLQSDLVHLHLQQAPGLMCQPPPASSKRRD